LLTTHRHHIVVVPSSSSFNHRRHCRCRQRHQCRSRHRCRHCRPLTSVVVAIIATILVVGIAAVSVAAVAVVINIGALLLSCLSYSLAVNPRNSTKASQGGITHGVLMERLSLGWWELG
jgi:hypothetical protein